MLDVDSAVKLIKDNFPNFGESEVSILDAQGQLCINSFVADRDFPPFDRVMMDGIAIKYSAILDNINKFKISGIAPAGSPQKELCSQSDCIEVMTGAVMPKNSNLVIPYEEVNILEGYAHIDLSRSYLENANIHFKGSDISKSCEILESHKILNGPRIGIAASVGASKVKVKKDQKNLKINIISTGDELVDIDEIPLDFQIRRSNSIALKTSLNLFGYSNVTLDHINDNEEEIAKHFIEASKQFDVLIYSGGVSKGKFDYLPEFWLSRGVEKVFHQIKQRPGKPLWFGVDRKTQTAIFGLPGNPVSSLVCLHRYFLSQKEIYVELDEDFVFKKDLTYFAPVKISYTKEAKIVASIINIKNSGEFSALALSDGFIELPANQDVFRKGECFKYFSWSPI